MPFSSLETNEGVNLNLDANISVGNDTETTELSHVLFHIQIENGEIAYNYFLLSNETNSLFNTEWEKMHNFCFIRKVLQIH